MGVSRTRSGKICPRSSERGVEAYRAVSFVLTRSNCQGSSQHTGGGNSERRYCLGSIRARVPRRTTRQKLPQGAGDRVSVGLMHLRARIQTHRGVSSDGSGSSSASVPSVRRNDQVVRSNREQLLARRLNSCTALSTHRRYLTPARAPITVSTIRSKATPIISRVHAPRRACRSPSSSARQRLPRWHGGKPAV